MIRRTVPLAFLVLALAPGTAEAAWPGLNGRITLTQRVPAGPGNEPRANRDIFAYARDGTRAVVPDTEENEEQPSWSPDGRWLAFKRRDAVYVTAWDRAVTTWDPSGQWALTTPRVGTSGPNINNTQPGWSPDMRSIIFRSNRDYAPLNVADIWVMDAPTANARGGTDQRALIVRPGDERYPTFSPDGTRIAFRGDDDGIAPSGDEEIFVANADGTGIVQLTDDDALDSAPAWSPDGSRIAWESLRDGDADREIFVMDADGTDVVQLTRNELHDEGPAWAPDGRMIAFTRSPVPEDPGDVWLMNADGTEQRHFTSTPYIEESPDWQPLPVTIGSDRFQRVACGDLSLLPGGVASVVTVKAPCRRALRVAERWQQGAAWFGRRPARIGAYRCRATPHSFDQVVIECRHAGDRKGVAFVYRNPAPAG